MKINKHIEIVRSSKMWLSSLSLESAIAIQNTLSKDYMKVTIVEIDDSDDLDALIIRKPDLVFLGVKFIPYQGTIYSQHSKKIWLSDYLDKYEIAYTGSDGRAHGLELDKTAAKQRVLDDGFNTSRYLIVKQDQELNYKQVVMSYPLFVKPSNRGGGLGVDSQSVVNDYEELITKINSISKKHHSDSLVEKYLTGREFSVAILKNQMTGQLQAMPIELITKEDDHGISILSAEVKSGNQEKVKEVIDQNIKKLVCDLALNVFTSLGARDYGRIDIRFDDEGVPHFLEANLIPSLISGYGSFPKACLLNLSMEYEDMILNIVELALSRTEQSTDFVIDDCVEVSPFITSELVFG